MLTGDAKRVAEQVAETLGVDEVYSELLPGDKVSKVEALLEKETGGKLALSETGSTMRRCFPEQISESPWEPWVRTRLLRRQMWCSWMTTL